MSDAPFDAQNAGYAQLLYEQFARNPQSVPESWRKFFSLGTSEATSHGLLVPESLDNHGSASTAEPLRVEVKTPEDGERLQRVLGIVSRATSFIQAFRDHGHMLAAIDPLGSPPPGHPQLDPTFFGTTFEELEQIPAAVVLDNAPESEPLSDAIARFREAYADYIGYEFEHIEDPSRVRWLWDQVESGVHTRPLSPADARWLLERLSQVEGFEQFLHRTYLGQKRFSIEGTDMLVPMIDLAIEETARGGGERVVIGMAHRGRLNVLAHILGVSYEELLRAFEGLEARGALNVAGTGDVKYHHGAEGDYKLRSGERIRVALAPNPSHLEFVNPVVAGMARALQFTSEEVSAEQDFDRVVPVMIHGDAAFAAEGVVAETLNMARLPGYTVGGAIHIIANNQIGFTTSPGQGRSTRYASDVAKGYDFPILHVNADRPDACLAAMRLAMAYRREYHDDVVIDLVGYRRHGHNEGDEPAYTQPKLYDRISDHPTVRTQWAERLTENGAIPEDLPGKIEDAVTETLRGAQDRVKAEDVDAVPEPKIRATRQDPTQVVDPDTALGLPELRRVNTATVTVPDGFTVHSKLDRQRSKRRDEFTHDTTLDWAYAEALAFGTLMDEGRVVRLTGQDSQRGTFSQRHLVLHDAETGDVTTPLASLGRGRLEVYNSPLTEAGVVGFEYGYSVASKSDLTLWEGQFGDFVNVAQVAIDQFISSGREKWGQVSNLTLLLPHGYEGQGPEHSSARLERFLQLCAEDNMRVAYPTTPAQYFHLLRRQAYARPERPLIVMTPKSLLRLPAATSVVGELVDGSFSPVLDDPHASERRGEIRRLVLCSGKVYYDIQGSKRRDEAPHVAAARLEEIYPFPKDQVARLVARYPGVEEVVWVQEEPRNMGALTFVGPRLRAAVPRDVRLRHVARPERASPAEGKASDHMREQQRIVRDALGLPPKSESKSDDD
ncbi:MAG TPA: 2-oxoglutarate dehydrogenase E1 component [Longimicrobiales bacterium]|nr:2-oxoglutarate dehydrogenase E1 component [Longimicrobiales bacterium]